VKTEEIGRRGEGGDAQKFLTHAIESSSILRENLREKRSSERRESAGRQEKGREKNRNGIKNEKKVSAEE